jgi:hypothetical protein
VSAEDILEQFQNLDLSRIDAALTYYYANRQQIEDEIAAEERLGEELAAKYPNGWTFETNHP